MRGDTRKFHPVTIHWAFLGWDARAARPERKNPFGRKSSLAAPLRPRGADVGQPERAWRGAVRRAGTVKPNPSSRLFYALLGDTSDF